MVKCISNDNVERLKSSKWSGSEMLKLAAVCSHITIKSCYTRKVLRVTYKEWLHVQNMC